ncbi:MAG: translation elongation factor Ts [Myxococcota bacterium]
MAITAKMVAELRAKTGAGMMDAKKALQAAEGDFEKAEEELRKKGIAKAGKKAGRVAAEGSVSSYIHAGGKIGVLLEVNSETDFVARGDDFQAFAKDVAMHIAASSPRYVRREEVPADVVEKEKKFLSEQAAESGKPANVVEKMVEGRIGKFFKDICLLEQPFVKDPDKTVLDLQNDIIAKIGEKIEIRRFSRFELGEGIEKKQEDFAAEVAKQVQGA